MLIGSLFSGIGGLELGLEMAGLGEVVWQVERDPFCLGVLARHWPDARRFHDVRKVGADCLDEVQVICGGFPCQDVSVAGLGAGLSGARSGLWHHFARIVDECQPHAVIVENVAHGRARWLCEVRSDLRGLGYHTRAVQVSAQDVGAPHQRERIFVVALPDADSFELWERPKREPGGPSRGIRHQGSAEPADHRKASGRESLADVGGALDGIPGGLDGRSSNWPLRRGPIVDPAMVEPWPSYLATDRLKALGNAVVPACAEVIGRMLLEIL